MITKETPRRLDPQKVVDSALAIADDEGPAAVTLRRLAQLHGVTPMALYRHFKDKDDLLAALGDRLISSVVLPEPTDEPWDKQLHTALTAFVTALRGHPRLADLTLPRMLVSEDGLQIAERVLQVLTEGGFDVDDAAEVGRQSICSLIYLVTTDPITREVNDPVQREDSLRRKRAALGALSPHKYPLVTAAADTLVCPSSNDRYYELGIDLVVAGICGIKNKE
ncbi:TetR/AcrR family transcriptional regulator C-terminal domain-containing protein [Kribbella albertanoniae]|uniref:TetR family transcriptional regulator n=1 Tax=Kribbella albertanoniae TaxID=1266829 RepID=A0A4R4P1T7_9ACTN|nr:TetR/AcrR family transcriptional regulator [Kribbella albertanoniae]TDC14623.1 TetR family transcriptional regulator [Kribbella albertanoniae]